MTIWHVLPPVTRTVLSAILCVAVVRGQQTPPGKPGQVEGIVTNSVTGDPLKKATVLLQAGRSNYEAVTDTAGHFHFDNVAPGTYQVTANRDGFAQVSDRHIWSKPITVATANTNDLGEYQMMDLAGGRYYFRVTAPQRMRNLSIRTRHNAPEMAYPDTFYPNVSLLAQATATQVAPGAQVTNIDFHLRKVRAFHIRGKAIGRAARSRVPKAV